MKVNKIARAAAALLGAAVLLIAPGSLAGADSAADHDSRGRFGGGESRSPNCFRRYEGECAREGGDRGGRGRFGGSEDRPSDRREHRDDDEDGEFLF